MRRCGDPGRTRKRSKPIGIPHGIPRRVRPMKLIVTGRHGATRRTQWSEGSVLGSRAGIPSSSMLEMYETVAANLKQAVPRVLATVQLTGGMSTECECLRAACQARHASARASSHSALPAGALCSAWRMHWAVGVWRVHRTTCSCRCGVTPSADSGYLRTRGRRPLGAAHRATIPCCHACRPYHAVTPHGVAMFCPLTISLSATRGHTYISTLAVAHTHIPRCTCP
jgi:hypothetical protein